MNNKVTGILDDDATEIQYDGKRRVRLIGPPLELNSSCTTRGIEITDNESRRMIFVDIPSVGSAIKRVRELLKSKPDMSVVGIAEEMEDEFEVEPYCFSCVLELDEGNEDRADDSS